MDPNAPSYIERDADGQLLAALLAGEYVFLLDSRQKGKSSLIARMIVKLKEQGVDTVKLDLQRIGANVTPDQWYAGLLTGIGQELGLTQELFEYWGSRQAIGPLARWVGAIQDVVLPKTDRPVVVFIDEIDFVRALPFATDEFFAAIRDCYNRRSEVQGFERLTFCLVGVATPGQLIRNPEITPFNIGTRIDLSDFTRTETEGYAKVLEATGRNGAMLMQRVHHWVSGHPYLTQLLCNHIAANSAVDSAQGVDRLVKDLFFTQEARQREPNFADVERRMLDPDVPGMSPDERRAQVLDLYGRLLRGKGVEAADENPVVASLRLAGVGHEERGTLRVRNRTYARVFDEGWRRQSLPDGELRRQRGAARLATLRTTAVAGAVLLGLGAAALGFWRLSNDRQRLIGQLESTAEELKRQNYVGKMASIRLAMASDRWMRVAELARQIRNDPYRGWEWGHVAMTVHALEPEGKLPSFSILAPQQDGRMLGFATDGLYEVKPDEVRLARHFQHGDGGPSFSRGNLLVVEVQGNEVRTPEMGPAVRDAYTNATLIPPRRAARIADVDPTKRRYLLIRQEAPDTVELRTIEGDRLLTAYQGPGVYRAARFLPDGTCLSVHEGGVCQWDSSGTTHGDVEPLPAYSADVAPTFQRQPVLALSSDGRLYAVSGGGLKQLEVRRVGNHKIASVLSGPPVLVNDIAFSADGHRILIGCGDGIVRLFDVKTGRLMQASAGHTYSVWSVAFSQDGQKYASVDEEGYCRFWSVKSTASIETFPDHDDQVVGAHQSADGRRVVSISKDGTIVSRDLVTGRVARRVAPLSGSAGRFIIERFKDTGCVFLESADGRIARLYGDSLKEERSAKVFSSKPIGLKVLPGGQRILAASHDQAAVDQKYAIVNAKTLRVVSRFQLKTTPGASLHLRAFDRGGQYVALRSLENHVLIYSTMDGRLVKRLKFSRAVIGMALSPDGGELAVSQANHGNIFTGGRIALFDVQSERELGVLTAWENAIFYLSWSPNGRILGTISNSGTGQLWNVRTRSEVAKLTGSMTFAMGFSPDGERLISSGSAHELRIFDGLTGEDLMTLSYRSDVAKGPDGSTGGDLGWFGADGRDVVVACTDGSVRIWHSIPWK